MQQREWLGLVLLHGLPSAGETNPFQRLEPLVQDLEGFIPAQNVFRYRWRDDLPVDPLRPALQGRLGALIAPRLHERFQEYQNNRRDIGRWVVGGFSAGGWGFYQWLVGWPADGGVVVRPSREQRDRIIFAFAIGSPHRNVHDVLYFGGDPRAWPTRKWELDADVLFHALEPGTLHIAFSREDRTVWPDNAGLPEAVAQLGIAHQLPLPDGDHDSLCADERVREYILESLADVLTSIPNP